MKKPSAPTTPPNPGIDSIMQALAVGGQPLGQMGKLPSGINPSQGDMTSPAPHGQGRNAQSQPIPAPGQSPLPGQAGVGPNPTQTALANIDPQQLQLIIQALLGGAFNPQPDPGNTNGVPAK